jgi:predicted RNA-binding protein YlxR (DUF448 family)
VLEEMTNRTLEAAETHRTTRTCLGCGLRDDKGAMLRLTVVGGEVVFHPSFQRGRGAHLHPRPNCIAGATRGLGRAFKGEIRIDPSELGRRLVSACDKRMVGLLLAARRRGALAIGESASSAALRSGAPLAIVAVDAGSATWTMELERAVASGRAIAWKTKSELSTLLSGGAVAICVVCHGGIASELRWLRAAVDAAMTATREGAECSKFPEAR